MTPETCTVVCRQVRQVGREHRAGGDGPTSLAKSISNTVQGSHWRIQFTYDQAAAVTVDDMTVSKTHLAVGQTGGDVWIEDLQSRNGVSVWSPTGTETRIAPGRRAILDEGDRVIVGDETSFTISAAS